MLHLWQKFQTFEKARSASSYQSCRMVNCDICGKGLKDQVQLKSHIKIVHNDSVIKHTCEICQKEFKTRPNLNRHIQIHDKQKHTFPCTICNAKLTLKCNLKDHMKIHTIRSEKCDICGKVFKTKKGLNSHIRGFHESLNSLKCPKSLYAWGLI